MGGKDCGNAGKKTGLNRRRFDSCAAHEIKRKEKAMQKHIIRGNHSGVFYGEIASRSGQEVVIKNCRRLWYWSGAASLSQLAAEGVKCPDDCKFTVTVENLTILDAIELIPCTDAACASIDSVPVWKI